MTAVVVERACDYCRVPFTPARSDARYCCSSHRALASKRNRNPQPATVADADSRERTEKAAIADAEPARLVWEPELEQRSVYTSTEACPDCGEMLLAGPRGTWRVCGRCCRPVVLPAVSAPYQGGQQRQVVSQREKDLAAIGLARRKGVMLAQLGALAADDRLHPESAPVVEWYAAEVRAATTESRLDELAALADGSDSGIRRRRWWQGRSAAIAGQLADHDDDDDLDDDDSPDLDDIPHGAVRPLAIEAAPPAPSVPMTWAGALEAWGYRLSPTVGGCQIIDSRGVWCAAPSTHHVTGPHGEDGWICDSHHRDLVEIIATARRST